MPSIQSAAIILILASQCFFVVNVAFAHPASGIGVDVQSHVYFIYSGRGVMRIEPSGKLTNIHEDKGGYWLALDADGVFADVTPRQIERITPDGRATSILKSERPWSPTGVAVSGGDIYVLEYTNANGPATEGWRPRVRKLRRDSKVTTLASDGSTRTSSASRPK